MLIVRLHYFQSAKLKSIIKCCFILTHSPGMLFNIGSVLKVSRLNVEKLYKLSSEYTVGYLVNI